MDIGIDLGTANTVILHENKVVVDEPSIIAIDSHTKNVVAVGKKALMMEGKTSGDIYTVRPLRNGVIADFQPTELMLREFIKMTNTKHSFITPAMKMIICIPSGITEVEERAVRESAEQAGAKEVRLIYEPMAAAIGSGIDVLDANGNQLQVTLSKSMSQGFWSDHLEKGDFLKLSNVTLGYKIPIAGIVKNYINSARVFVSASNVFCITGYSGIDPEVSNYFLAPGIDYQDKYPTTRSFSFGLTVNF